MEVGVSGGVGVGEFSSLQIIRCKTKAYDGFMLMMLFCVKCVCVCSHCVRAGASVDLDNDA